MSGPEPTSPLRSLDDLESRFRQWAVGRPDIEAVIVVGSRARVDHPADEWADLDLGIVTTDPARYSDNATWLNEIGEVWVAYKDPVGTSWHVLFTGGLDAGVAPIPASMLRTADRLLGGLRSFPAARRLLPSPLRRRLDQAERDIAAYCGRGTRVIVDRRGRVERFLRAYSRAVPPAKPPTRAEFEASVTEFWFAAVWAAKHLRRGELWYAKNAGVDGHMKTLLLRILEWHARANGERVDTWENGRFLEEWADPDALRQLPNVFGHYAADDVWLALIATMDLFRQLACETAERLGYPYAEGADRQVTTWVTQRYTETLT
jgi:aminoglycoside 6-adenylyltransferase